MSSSSTIHIIGAGLAGLAAALKASEDGHAVVLYEAAPQAGGRCRSFYDKKLKTTIDNGNHLAMGVNRAVLDYLDKLGTRALCITDDTPHYPFFDLKTRRLHRFSPPRFKGIPWHEWWHLAKLFRPAADKTVAQCIPPHTALYQRLIEPLTLAALNTHPQHASAALLAQGIRMLTTGGKAAWQYYVPSALSPTFIDPALLRIKGRGGRIHLGTAIRGLEMKDGCIHALRGQKEVFSLGAQDSVILAVSPAVLGELLPENAPPLTYSPIVNAHFLWPQAGKFREAMPFLGIIGGTVQWIFFHEGRLSTTTSAADDCVDMEEPALAQQLWQEVCRALFLGDVRLPPYRIIKEKRATFAATPDNVQHRPSAHSSIANLFLAGDYLASPYPATMEAAINSGYAAAALASAYHPQGNND